MGDDVAPGRKDWIENRLKELDEIFAVSVGGFSLMDNHLHLLLRIDPEVASAWSDSEVVERWFRLFPPRCSDRKPLKASKELLAARVGNVDWVVGASKRLSSLGWFMKCLKEPLARLTNKQDKCTGAFFEGRFKSIAILDEESLVSVCAYIDLNPVAAGIAETPEASEHTSIKARVELRTIGPVICRLRSLVVWRPRRLAVGLRMSFDWFRLKIDESLVRCVKGCGVDLRWGSI